MPIDSATTPPSGFTFDYTDGSTGAQFATAWIQITSILYMPVQSCLVVFDVYKDAECYDEMNPVFSSQRLQSNFGDTAWNTYFDPAVMDQVNCDIQAQALAYLQANL